MDELQGEKKDPTQDSVAEPLFSSASVDHFETIDSPRPIVNGLQLIEKSAGSHKPFKCFSYATSPLTQEPLTMEKTMIWHRPYAIQCEHVRCHVLTPDDNIPELIVKYSRQHAQAVLLINTANNYTLICDAACSDIPVLVVTSQDGEELLLILDKFKPGDILVQILQKDSEFSSEPSSTPFHRGTLLPAKASSKSQLSKGVLFDPWKEFKVYTFPKEGPLCVCRDIVKFQLVMCAFNQLEYEVKSPHEAQGKQLSENVLKKMNRKLEKYKNNPVAFEENFPLYVLLVIHMHRRRDVYQCGELEKFHETVLERMELLPVERVAEILNGFLEQDFNIMKGDECVSTFHSLYDACEGILVLQLVKKYKRNIYCWILWINILLRCCQCDVSVSSDEVPRTAERLWDNFILKKSSSITLKKETIQHIRKGMKLGVLLLLPDELQFNASRLSSLLFPHNLIRPLQHVRNFIFENQEQLVQNEEQFVSSFVRKSREHYACLFDAHDSALKFSDASVDHTVQGFVGEGVDFLDTVWLVSMRRQWNSDAFKEECRKWFSLLLKAVEIKKGVESVLGMLLASSTFAKDCRTHIEAEIIKKTREMFGKMDISVFYPMYKAFIIWSNEVNATCGMHKYLHLLD